MVVDEHPEYRTRDPPGAEAPLLHPIKGAFGVGFADRGGLWFRLTNGFRAAATLDSEPNGVCRVGWFRIWFG